VKYSAPFWLTVDNGRNFCAIVYTDDVLSMIATSQSDYNLLNARSHIRRRVHATILTDEIPTEAIPTEDTLTLTLTPDP